MTTETTETEDVFEDAEREKLDEQFGPVVGHRDINGVDFEIRAQAGRWGGGQWTVRRGDIEVRHDSLERAIAAAGAAERKRRVKIEVPFVRVRSDYGNWRIERGVATGIHAGNRSVLTKVEGRNEQVRYESVFPADTPDDVLSRYVELQNEYRLVRKAISDLEAKHQVDLRKEVEKAIEAAQTGA